MNEHFFDVSPYVQKYVNVNAANITKRNMNNKKEAKINNWLTIKWICNWPTKLYKVTWLLIRETLDRLS